MYAPKGRNMLKPRVSTLGTERGEGESVLKVRNNIFGDFL